MLCEIINEKNSIYIELPQIAILPEIVFGPLRVKTIAFSFATAYIY